MMHGIKAVHIDLFEFLLSHELSSFKILFKLIGHETKGSSFLDTRTQGHVTYSIYPKLKISYNCIFKTKCFDTEKPVVNVCGSQLAYIKIPYCLQANKSYHVSIY